jgi:polyphosphate glucokinase
VLTLGTGIGSALIVDGRLVPNTSSGHLELDGVDAETRASDAARDREDLSWAQWAERVERYLGTSTCCSGRTWSCSAAGVSKKAQHWLPLLDVRPPLQAAELRNDAGIIGAACSQRADRSTSSAGASRLASSR